MSKWKNLEKVAINIENYEKILNLAFLSSSRTDLLNRLGWYKNAYQFNKLSNLLIEKKFNFDLFTKDKKVTLTSIFKDSKRLKTVVEKSHSYAGVFRVYDRKVSSASLRILKKYIEIYKISISHFNSNDKYLDPEFKTYKTNEEILVENSKADKITVKKRILKDKLIEYKCNGKGCNITGEWLGNKITLQLEHKNGNGKDNRIENLEFLCPNCHSITPTWGGRNIKHASKKTGVIFVRKLEMDVKNLINFVLPECKDKKEVLDKYSLRTSARNYNGLNLILEKNNLEDNVKKFVKKQEICFPELSLLIEKIKKFGFKKVGREIGCADNTVRNYLIKNNVNLETLKNRKYTLPDSSVGRAGD